LAFLQHLTLFEMHNSSRFYFAEYPSHPTQVYPRTERLPFHPAKKKSYFEEHFLHFFSKSQEQLLAHTLATPC